MTIEHEYENTGSIDDEEFEIAIKVEIEPYTPAHITGDPYFSYPEEGGYASLLSVHVNGKDITDSVTPELRDSYEREGYERWSDEQETREIDRQFDTRDERQGIR
jgi:hypothetical protein